VILLKEKWVLITGASGGIGSAISIELARLGYQLYLHYSKGREKAEKVKQACEQYGGNAILLQADFLSMEDIQRMVGQMARKPDVLINNAGITHYGLFTETNEDDVDRLWQINVKAPFMLAKLLTPHMVRQRYGRIINISSIWGLTGASCEVLYSTTKGALLSLSKALAKELAPSGVSVNAVVPGAIAGELMSQHFSQEDLETIADEIPMGRLGKPEEIASLVSFLLLPNAEYITGQVISPNGGWYT
jgi:3-oxoacyl-[acyl-carrier protein] reductase